MEDRHVLVLGGCGYIGTVLTAKLLEKGFKVTVFDIMWFGTQSGSHENLTIVSGDVRNVDTIPMKDVNIVIHLANVANDPCGDLNSKLVWEINALASMQIVEKAVENGVEQFIYASSGSVYGIKEEEHVTEDLPLLPISDYNKTKMVSERILLSYQDQICLQIVRPATVCGISPRMRLDVSVNMLTMQALSKQQITVFGGQQTRPNIHIRDIVRIFEHFIETRDRFQGVFNAGFENISIMDIAAMVAEQTRAGIQVTDSNDPRSYRLNSDKLLATGFVPKYGVKYAIKEIIQAYHHGNLRDNESGYNIKIMKKLMEEKNI